MAIEYMLPYTASEIVNKLGQIDSKLDADALESAIETALAEAKASGEFNGEDGTAITSAIINNGGELVITYSDGTTDNLGVVAGADGRDGVDGYSPIKGVDYWTEYDQNEVKTEVDTIITEEFAKRGQLKPEFANNIAECTDTTKLYVLPDGYIYAYKLTEVVIGGYTNQIPISTDADGNIYNDGKGFKDGHRFNSSRQEATQTNSFITGFIPIKVGDTVYINGNYIDAGSNIAGSLGHVFYRSDDKTISLARVDMAKAEEMGNCYSSFEVNSDGYVTSFTINGDWNYVADWNELGYVRLNLLGSGEGCVVTVNEEIIEATTEIIQSWTNTGRAFIPTDYEDRIITIEEQSNRNTEDILENSEEIAKAIDRIEGLENGIMADAIPSEWRNHINNKIEVIKNLHRQYGKDCFSFVLMTDTHYPSNLGKISPLLAKTVMDKANIKYVLHAGDYQTRGCHQTKELLLEENEKVEEMFMPIMDRLLWQQGNHDGAYGLLDRDVNGSYNNSDSSGNTYPPNERETYIHNLTPQEIHEYLYRKVGMVGDVHFDDSGTAYYIDDKSNNVRYIGLNTQCNNYELQADGTQKYPKMWIMQFMQPQFDFLINEALVENVTDKTKIVIFAHVPTTQEIRDRELMNGVLNAFVNRAKYTGSYAGVGADHYGAVSVNVDFVNAKGRLVGYFHGHTHQDSVNTGKGFNIIGTSCDAHEENDDHNDTNGMWYKRYQATNPECPTYNPNPIYEQSFDVFTVTNDIIYRTKIGAGANSNEPSIVIPY